MGAARKVASVNRRGPPGACPPVRSLDAVSEVNRGEHLRVADAAKINLSNAAALVVTRQRERNGEPRRLL
eukprot:4925367-Alexandrium_andersonii.AAC.1